MTLRVPVTDSTGAVVTNLATATAVYFMIKENRTDANTDALVNIPAGQITVDDPIQGTVSVRILNGDTEGVEAGNYYMGLQIVYAGGIVQEINLKEQGAVTDRIKLSQDVVRGA